MMRLVILLLLLTITSAATTCDDYSKDEKKCLSAKEGNDACAFCTSAAVGTMCAKASDAKTLPTSVFQCEYSPSSFYDEKPSTSASAATTCDAYSKDEKKCLSAKEGNDACAFCTSAAVGTMCAKASDAKTLPTSVFQCEFASSFYDEKPSTSASAATTCDDYSKDEKKCLSAKEGNDACAFCTSAAVGTMCAKEADAKTLPTSVFQCEFASSSSSSSSSLSSYNETSTGYSSSAALNYAKDYCAKDSEWLCAEFVARSLHAGGLFDGVSDYGSYKGYNLRMVTDLHKALKSLYGWSESSSGTWCGSAGQVLIYNGNDAVIALKRRSTCQLLLSYHYSRNNAALAIGNCLLDQHNPSRCGTNAAWGTNVVLKP